MARQDDLHVISGGPGSGKTSIIEALRKRGYRCVDEVGRQIIREQVKIGGTAVHWGDRVAFMELMLSRGMRDYEAAAAHDGPVFFDRGIAELIGYCRLIGVPVPDHVRKAAELFPYNRTVFVTPPWPEIYASDSERKQDLAEAVRTFEVVAAAYAEVGYRVIEVPRAPVAERAAFVLERSRPATGPR